MAYRTPPFITPVALVSIILALSAANAIVNVSTHTSNGAPKQVSSVVSTSVSSEKQQSNVSSEKSSSDTSESRAKVSTSEATDESSAVSEIGRAHV